MAVLRRRCAVPLLAVLCTALVALPAGAAKPPASQGQTIAFQSNRGGGPDLFAVAPVGGIQLRLTGGRFDSRDPSFSPNGNRIAFWSNRGDGAAIYVMDADGDNVERVSQKGIGAATQPSFSPNGKQIAFVSHLGGDSEIYTMNSDDGTSPFPVLNGKSPGQDSEPVFSPDGKKIAFTRTFPGKGRDILVVDRDGTDLVNLTKSPAVDNSHPSFSADGKRIVFQTLRRGRGGYEIFSMDADDGDHPLNLTKEAGADTQPSFSPNGKKVVFSRYVGDGTVALFTMDADGSDQQQITSPADGTADIAASWGR